MITVFINSYVYIFVRNLFHGQYVYQHKPYHVYSEKKIYKEISLKYRLTLFLSNGLQMLKYLSTATATTLYTLPATAFNQLTNGV